MGLRRRDRSVDNKSDLKKKSQFCRGDLIYIDINKGFPITLRDGPGYIFKRVEHLEYGKVGIIIDTRLGHGAIVWICIFVSESIIGWIPGSIMKTLQKVKI